MTYASEVQRLSLGAPVVLYELDCTGLGGEVLRFAPGTVAGDAPQFGGHVYTPINLEADGFDVGSDGTLPRPTLSISNANAGMQALLVQLGSLRGAVVRRIKTFAKFLDSQPEADPTQHEPIETWLISRCMGINKIFAQWELTTVLDSDLRLPARQVLRDYCPWRYRHWTGGGFDYSQAVCPYTGAAYFTVDGKNTADPAQDVCGKRLSDCRLRYGRAVKPFGGFPGVARTRRTTS